LTNRRMRARMSGGVGGDGATPPPTGSAILRGFRIEAPEGWSLLQLARQR
jgi:hypothetical protein